ncbi:MAG TPA: beta-propeller fold lactonase family protein [Stellaceae bacterium]|nr:beta-propeller fold lactonase family protein [Stellaceae bacterium]
MNAKPVIAGATALVALSGIFGAVVPNHASAATVAYISNADSRDIYVMALDAQSGGLTLIDKTPTTGTVMPLAISPDRHHLYASLRSEPFSVSSFTIDPATGKLGLLSTVPLPDNMANIATDRTGRFLFSASYTGHKIAVNPIGPQGAVLAEPVDVIATRKNAHSTQADPSNRYVFATNLGGDIVLQYRFDPASGKLTPNDPPFVETKQGAGPRHIAFHPTNRFVYGTNELDGTVNTYRFDADKGTLTLIGTVSAVPPDFKGAAPAASDLHITADGRFLYAAERTSNTLAAYRIDAATGTLTPAGNFATETQPRGFNLDPRGKFLVAVGQKSDSATVYAIDGETGGLKALQRYPVGKNPNWVEIIDLP